MFHLVAAVAEEAAYHNNIAALFQSLAELLSAAVLLLFLLATMLAVVSLVVVLLLVRASVHDLEELCSVESSSPSQFPAVSPSQFPAVAPSQFPAVSVVQSAFLLLLQNDLPRVPHILPLAAAAVVEDFVTKEAMMLRLDPLYHAVLALPVVVFLHLEDIVSLAAVTSMVLLSSFLLWILQELCLLTSATSVSSLLLEI